MPGTTAATWGPASFGRIEPEARAVSVTPADLAMIEARFDDQTPGHVWCGYAHWWDGTCFCLALFLDHTLDRRLLLTRLVDGTFSAVNETGQDVWSGSRLADLLDRLANQRRDPPGT